MDVLYLVLILVVSGGSAYGACVLGKKSPRAGWVLVGVGFVLLLASLLSRIVPAYFSGLQPASLMAECLYGLSFVFVGGVASRFRRSFRERLMHDVLAVLLAYFVVADAAYFALRGAALRALDGKTHKGVTVQSTGFTCAPCSMTTVLRRWGIENSEGEAAYAMRTSFRGSTLARAPQAIERLGASRNLQAKIVYSTFEELEKYDVPVMLSTYYGKVHHSSALIGLLGEKLAAGEPTEGLILSTREKYMTDWRWRGQAVVIAPDFLYEFQAGDASPRAKDVFAKLIAQGYAADAAGIGKFNQDWGFDAGDRLDWRGILVLDARAEDPERPRLSNYPDLVEAEQNK
jgi:predicted double-glycine peptidase